MRKARYNDSPNTAPILSWWISPGAYPDELQGKETYALLIGGHAARNAIFETVCSSTGIDRMTTLVNSEQPLPGRCEPREVIAHVAMRLTIPVGRHELDVARKTIAAGWDTAFTELQGVGERMGLDYTETALYTGELIVPQPKAALRPDFTATLQQYDARTPKE
jgi:hypothetical protein